MGGMHGKRGKGGGTLARGREGCNQGPRSFQSQVLVPARARGAVLTSPLLTKPFASRKGGREGTFQFPEDHREGWCQPAQEPG